MVPGLLLALTIRLDYVKGRHPFSCAGYYAFACLGAFAVAARKAAAVAPIDSFDTHRPFRVRNWPSDGRRGGHPHKNWSAGPSVPGAVHPWDDLGTSVVAFGTRVGVAWCQLTESK